MQRITQKQVMPPPLWKIFKNEIEGCQIKQKPPLAEPRASVEYLRSKLIVKTAKEELRNLHWRLRLPMLFHHFFPVEFGKHEDSDFLDAHTCGPMLMEFYTLVESRLFCLNTDWLIEVMNENADEEGFYLEDQIPFMCVHNKDWWDDLRYSFEELEAFEQVILYAMGYVENNKVVYDPFNQAQKTTEIDMVKLARVCGDLPPLCYLPEAVHIVNHSANTVFINEYESSFEDNLDFPPWTIENVEDFAAEHKLALDMWKGVNKLDKWLRKDSPRTRSRQKKVEAIIRDCIIEKIKVRVMV